MADTRDNLTPKEKKLLSEIPIIWMIGPPGTGKNHISNLIVVKYDGIVINTRLLHKENVMLKRRGGQCRRPRRQRRPTALWPEAAQANSIMAGGSAGQ